MSETDGKPLLVVTSKTRGYVKEKGFKMSSETIDALNKKVYALLDEGLIRTEKNKRSTLRAQDL